MAQAEGIGSLLHPSLPIQEQSHYLKFADNMVKTAKRSFFFLTAELTVIVCASGYSGSLKPVWGIHEREYLGEGTAGEFGWPCFGGCVWGDLCPVCGWTQLQAMSLLGHCCHTCYLSKLLEFRPDQTAWERGHCSESCQPVLLSGLCLIVCLGRRRAKVKWVSLHGRSYS